MEVEKIQQLITDALACVPPNILLGIGRDEAGFVRGTLDDVFIKDVHVGDTLAEASFITKDSGLLAVAHEVFESLLPEHKFDDLQLIKCFLATVLAVGKVAFMEISERDSKEDE